MDNRRLYLDAETEFWYYIDDDYSVNRAIEEVCIRYPQLDKMTLVDYLYASYESTEFD